MQFSTLFFDLDATLYPASNGLWDLIRERIYTYMEEKVGIPAEDIPAARDHYWSTYGTTLEGLRIHHNVQPDDYLAFVHDIPLGDFLQADPELREILASLPQDLWVFTNSDQPHAAAVLEVLGIRDLFTGLIDLLAMDYAVKPQPKAFRIALELASVQDPGRCILFDDLVPNLKAARAHGLSTALVGENGRTEEADFHLPSIHDITTALPQLWSSS